MTTWMYRATFEASSSSECLFWRFAVLGWRSVLPMEGTTHNCRCEMGSAPSALAAYDVGLSELHAKSSTSFLLIGFNTLIHFLWLNLSTHFFLHKWKMIFFEFFILKCIVAKTWTPTKRTWIWDHSSQQTGNQ